MLQFTQCLVGEHNDCPEEVAVALDDSSHERLVRCPCKCHRDPDFDPRWEKGYELR